MDIDGEGGLFAEVLDIGGRPSNLNIGDVIEAISAADPDAAVALDEMAQPPQPEPYVHIVEQPASKALRFRYECEGRSAGSIPGVNSTTEHKTYPTIEVRGYTGRAIIVVSCVTRDEPYKPHPHNLVGRERCRNGVCTMKVDLAETARVPFSNLGIQCVKRRDVAEALNVRESQRVDPFKTGFAHKQQPQSIDLNAVRLCFQVFLLNDNNRHTITLPPVVSEIIYDKKAMSDLQITRISRPSGYARGGNEIILLCEKVTREDISVVLVDEAAGWEAAGNVIIVHKQVAIAFTTPAYLDPNTRDHVQVQIQLKRISDGARSNSVSFTYIPDTQGTDRKPLPDLTRLSLLTRKLSDNNNNNNENNNIDNNNENCVSSTSDNSRRDSTDSGSAVLTTRLDNGVESDDSKRKSLDDLLDQVAELDEIYSENRTRLENAPIATDNDEDFNDAGTYTSLQLAFRNPVSIAEQEPYEDVQVQTFRGPIIEFTPLKRDTEDERAPPLPPKRVRKTTEPFKSSQTSVDSILKPGKQLPVTRDPSVLRPRTELSVARSEPALPPVKKRSFFSRLFRRKDRSPAPSVNSEGKRDGRGKPVGRSVSSVSGLRPSKFKSSVSHTSLKDNTSTANLSYADSITHISLHGDENEKTQSQWSLRRPASGLIAGPLPPTDGGTILVAESVLALDATQFKKLQDDLDLTEAEHYALYMAVAPHATASEFDETSCYYSPIDGSKFQNAN